ncbi:hypothetical protein F4694_002417 [Bacillus niacini]|uniref:Uncharacterized protein n=1 Tax=Neobacillus niacini TaxID=86668 RepID=A0A852TEI1_9BACI|nr:hypothetical protein [Neobacillus niacini]
MMKIKGKFISMSLFLNVVKTILKKGFENEKNI